MTKTLPRPLSREGFAAWLAALPADAPAGTDEGCPLGHYLRTAAMGRLVGAQVGAWEYWVDDAAEIIPLERWAQRFVVWADGCASNRWERLTAGACLAALEEIP